MGNGDMPESYTTGIHRFGEKDVVFNLTSKLYCYNDPNDGTYVYFKNDTFNSRGLNLLGRLARNRSCGRIARRSGTYTDFVIFYKKKKRKPTGLML